MTPLKFIGCLVALTCMVLSATSQNLVYDKETEDKLYAQTKQVNQFFRRFNGEEDTDGNRLHQGDRDYRDFRLRQKYITLLFDAENGGISNDLKKDFIRFVADRREPVYLDFHSEDWFAEVNTVFSYKGRKQHITLYMNLQPERKGYEWVISDVAFSPFQELFHKDTTAAKKFLHPMSHELDFMNLRKAFRSGEPEAYTPHDFEPDYLTLFLYEIKRGNLRFETVVDVKFHFFQVDGWYFEISEFNRPGYNTGWLISNLVRVNNDNEKKALLNYIYGKN